MKRKREVFVISIVVLVSVNQSKEILCKARTGCQLAKCDPGYSLERLNINEYPLTCIQKSVQDKASTAEIDDLKKQLERLRTTLHMFIGRSCHGVKLESALARNDSGGVIDMYIPTIGIRGVFCDVTDEGGNWTRRMNADVEFFRGWDDYVKGFGDLQGDFWLGLEALHQMTREGNYEMKISMIEKDGNRYFAKYSNFRIGPHYDKYRLTISGYSGNAHRDSLKRHNNRQFTTKDADHDDRPYNCASHFEGAWWYDTCLDTNLNGNFNKSDGQGVWWRIRGGSFRHIRHLRYTEMKFRRRF